MLGVKAPSPPLAAVRYCWVSEPWVNSAARLPAASEEMKWEKENCLIAINVLEALRRGSVWCISTVHQRCV